MYKIAICDDDKDYIKELKDIILESNEKRLAIEFYDFDCGEKLLHSKIDDMDVIFLDIQIVQRVAVFHVQRYQVGAGVHAVLHELTQGYHHGADVQFVPVNEHPVDGVQGVV